MTQFQDVVVELVAHWGELLGEKGGLAGDGPERFGKDDVAPQRGSAHPRVVASGWCRNNMGFFGEGS